MRKRQALWIMRNDMDNPTKINIIIGCILAAGITIETKEILIDFMRDIEARYGQERAE